MNKPEFIGVEKLHQNKYLSLFANHYRLSDGSEKKYFVASRNKDYNPKNCKNIDAVTLFVLNKDMTKILVTNEFRYPVNDFTTSTPAGIIDEGESAIEAGIRELEEETGYCEIINSTSLPATYSSVGMTDERVTPVILHIDETISKSTNLGSGEIINHYWVNKDEAMQLALSAGDLTARAQLALILFAKGNLQDLFIK